MTYQDPAAGLDALIQQRLASNANPDDSARGILNTHLRQFGLESLADTVWYWYLQGRSIDQIFLDLKDTPEYKTRFPAMKTLAEKGHALSEAEYISLESSYSQIARQYGLPVGFYDQPDDFTSLIAGQVSPTEYSARLQSYQALVYDTDPTARQELNRLYGVTDGDIAAYFIDPDRSLPFLTQRFGAAQTAAASQRAGFGNLTQEEAFSLAGLDPQAAATGFSNLVKLNEVASQLPGEVDSGIDRSTLLDATLRGNENARRRVEQKQQRRKSVFEGGGAFSTTQSGVAGVGSA